MADQSTTPHDVLAAEKAAPVDQSGPLPLTVATLQFIPAEKRAQYKRSMDGSFRLAYVTSDDVDTITAHADAKIPIYRPGDSPEAQAARARAAEQMVQRVTEQVNRQEAAERAARIAAEKQRELDAINKKYGS